VSEEPDIIDRAVELFVYAPVGIAQTVLEAAPPFLHEAVERGREIVTRHVTTVRSTGEVALAFGLPMLRERLRTTVTDAVAGNAPVAPAPAPSQSVVTAPPAPSVAAAVADAPASTELPIPGYDALSASQVVERLAGLEPSELDAVMAYETAHRQRRTILGKIEQLAG
jgi:hypothetical protein